MLNPPEMVDKISFNYEEFVVVTETEWKFDYGDFEPKISCRCGCKKAECGSCGRRITIKSNSQTIKQAMRLGTTEWNIAFFTDDDDEKIIKFTCQSVAEGTVDEVHLELVAYHRSDPNESYAQDHDTTRRIFSRSRKSLEWTLESRDYLFTMRILKDRPMFPDFTLDSTAIARMGSNGKLLVAGQLFHINKQLLAMHSDHFDRMFNSKFKEARQEVVELKHDHADPAMFHDFLLVMCVAEALPNPKNVVALLNLANIYQAENVRDKCQRHLGISRELPAEERYLLARTFGLKELQTSIISKVSLDECKRIVAVVSDY